VRPPESELSNQGVSIIRFEGGQPGSVGLPVPVVANSLAELQQFGQSHKSKLFATSGNNLQIINAINDTVGITVPLSYTPGSQIAVNNTLRHIYLLNPAANKIEVRGIFEQVRGELVGTFSLGTGNTPQGIAADSVRGRVYVVVYSSGSYSVWAIEDLTSARQTGFFNGGGD